MTNLKLCLLAAAGSLGLMAAACLHASAGPAKAASQPAESPGGALSAERISAEPDVPLDAYADVDARADSLRWSPDGARVAWMQLRQPPPKGPDRDAQQEIWTLSAAANGKPEILVPAAKVTASLRGTQAAQRHKTGEDDSSSNPYALQDFAWFPGHASLLLVGTHSLAWLDLASGQSRILVAGSEALGDASLSPDGQTVCFLRNHGLWLTPARGGPARSVTPAAHAEILEGEPDWPYRREFHLARAYWWSPDSSRIAYLETDDHAVAKYTLRSSEGESREIVYPAPGGAIPAVRLFVTGVAGGARRAIQLGSTRDAYLPGVAWLPDGRHLAIQRIDRLQHTLELLLADTQSGSVAPLLSEKDAYWINLSGIVYFFRDSRRFLWSSERSGFRHLYEYDIHGKLLRQLTQGDWEVTRLNAVDETSGAVYFTATEKSPLERHLYRIDRDASAPMRVTRQPGTHDVHFAPDGKRFLDSFSTRTSPPKWTLATVDDPGEPAGSAPNANAAPGSQNPDRAASGAEMSRHDDSAQATHAEAGPGANSAARQDAARLPEGLPVEFLPFRLHLGAQTTALLIRPPAFDPTRKYPVIVYLAGGPGEQLVRDSWGGATGLWMQSMAQRGFLVFALDNQGTAGRGHYFEEPIHLRLGAQELTDQRDGLAYLGTLPYVDTTRLGVCGWGYGGFLAVHAVLDRPVAFKAGFAGAPIVDWRRYDAIFAERYLDDPVAHADGWAASSALENNSPHFFKSTLRIAQGTGDEFVHQDQSWILQDALLDAGKSADLLLLADRGHSIEDAAARLVLYRSMTEFFEKNL